MAARVHNLAITALLLIATTGLIRCHPLAQGQDAALAVAGENNNSSLAIDLDTKANEGESSSDELPAKWGDAIRQLMDTILGNPTEEAYDIIAEQVLALKPYVDAVFQGKSEERRDAFMQRVVLDLAKQVEKNSRVPLKLRVANMMMGRILEEFGRMPSPKPSKETMNQLKLFAEKLTVICKSDEQCKAKLKP